MHERIRRFSLETETKDNTNWLRIQDNLRNILEDKMREDGYVPNLDCGVHWSPTYLPDIDKFKIKMSMYGVFVGRKKSCTAAVYYDDEVHAP